jgi:hypothetical protein
MPFVLMGSDHVFSADFSYVCGNGLTVIRDVNNFDEFETFICILQNITESVFRGCRQYEILRNTDEQFASE